MIDAAEALRIGLVNRVVPHARFREEVGALAARLAAAPQASIRLVKQTLTAAGHRSLEECMAVEIEAQRLCWGTADVAEGTRAFVEKRAPRFGSPVPLEMAAARAGRRFE